MSKLNTARLHRTRQFGLTIVEVMVALAIGLLLTLGAIQIFVTSKQAYRTTESLSRVQENGRYGLHFLAKDVRGASFFGCAQDVEVTNVVNDASATIDLDGEPIEGTDGGAGPDTITMRLASQNTGVSVSQQMPNTSGALFLTDTTNIQDGDIMIVTDCEAADIFMVTNNNTNNNNLVHNSGVTIDDKSNSTQQFSKSYGVGAMAFSISERTYSVVNNNLQRSVNGTAETLVEGVEDLQIEYGVDIDNDLTVNTYVPADTIAANASLEWPDVVAVRIALTARSAMTNVAEDDGTGDGRVRKTFTRTIGVRNRLQ